MYSGASLCLEQKFVLKEFVFKGSDCTCTYSGVLLCLKQSFILKEFVLRGFDWIFQTSNNNINYKLFLSLPQDVSTVSV